MSSMRELLVSSLASSMRGEMAEPMARRLAHELTCMVSARVGNPQGPMGADLVALYRLPAFPAETWSVHTLGVPWEAFHQAFGGNGSGVARVEIKALCSTPAQLDSLLALQATQSGMWGGSLLVALGKIMGSACHDLVILSPYWRAEGVQSLLSTAGRDDYSGLRVRVFTQAAWRMGPEDQEGLAYFTSKMKQMGANVQTYAPKLIRRNTPFLHAKMLVADARQAYVGSANFTAFGLEHSIEAGVVVEGDVARSFSRWAAAIECACAIRCPEV